jgi:hypothetical protein
MSNVLDNLPITTWYKAVTVVSAAAFLIVLASQRDNLTMIFGGAFLFGIGEWKNHPKKQFELRPTTTGQWAKISDVPRKANWLGVLLQLAGVALVLHGMYWAFSLSLPQSK